MTDSAKFKLPAWTIMLDIVGTILLAGGLFGMFAGDNVQFVQALKLKALAIPMIILGVLLMAPLVVFAVKAASSRR